MAGRPGPFDAPTGRRVVIGRHEDDGDADSVSRQALLKIESAHSVVQVDVEKETGRSTPAQRIEKLPGRGEDLSWVAARLNQATQRPPNPHIVGHDCKVWGSGH